MCAKMIPKHEFGCKRQVFSLGEYLPLFVDRKRKTRPVLVTDPIKEITETGIRTEKENLEFDLIGKSVPCIRTCTFCSVS